MISVRLLHVLGMALVLGGATVTWWSFRQSGVAASADAESAVGGASGGDADRDFVVDTGTAIGIAAAYERGFWAATGVLVMTGVGNLGSLAPYVPDAGTRWGTLFAVKLLVVLTVLALSMVRTFVVWRCRRADAVPERGRNVLRVGYGATAAAFAVVVALAEVLAHG